MNSSTDFEDFPADVEPSRSFARGRCPSRRDPGRSRRSRSGGAAADQGATALDDDDFIGDEPARTARRRVDEEIDAELEQEIRREIDEIAELEREMGLRGPAEAGASRGDEPARGGRSTRGRGLVKPPIQEIFRRGDEVLVQVIKESIGTKGPTLSTYISIPGRYLVLMPGLNRVGVSRKIVDEGQRRKLREIMNELNPPKGLGFIVRTAGLERTKRELARDLAYLLRLWKVILRRIKKSKAPTPIYQESDMIIRTIRDIFNSEIDTIWIDEPSAFERAQDFLKVVMPRFVNRLKLYDEKVPLFHKYGIEDEIAKIQRRHVPLPEGGSIVIDQTEALVAIDVNSGNFRVEDDAERTAYEMNLRAAKEIARQLRLRDLGGVIVNDFIDMREERHRRGVERALREAIKRDRARTKVLRMSAFGLIEMTRQRIRPSLKRSIYEDCPHCGGAGVAKTAESMAIDVMRLLALATHREEIRRIAISVHPSVATYLGNRKRKEIAKLESECNMTIQIGFEENSPAEHLKIECFDANGNEVRLHPNAGLDPQTRALSRCRDRSRCGQSRCPHRAIRPARVDRLSRLVRLDHPCSRILGIVAMTFQPAAGYPLHRPRRLRGHPRLRDLVCETHLAVDDLIYPLFVYHGKNLRREIPSMPGQYQLSLDRLGEAVAEVSELGIPAIILFGIPEHKDARGSAALRDDGIVQEAIRLARQVAPDLLVITDLCFCEYTDHGHCGPLAEIGGRIDVDNDATLPLLAEQAVSHARAGADMIAPSGMMDGMVQAIRQGLDRAGLHQPADHVLRRQVRQRLLRTVSRRRRKLRRASATAAPTRWTRPTPTRPSAKSPSTWPKGPTSSWSNRPWPTSTSSVASRRPAASPWRPTMSRANTP